MFPHQLKMPAPVLHYTFGEAQYTNTTEDVQYITTLKNMSQYQYRAAHSQTDNLTLYKLTNCQKQIACQSQLKMLASVLHYTFREAQRTSTRRCPIHNDTEEHNCTGRNVVMGK